LRKEEEEDEEEEDEEEEEEEEEGEEEAAAIISSLTGMASAANVSQLLRLRNTLIIILTLTLTDLIVTQVVAGAADCAN
jgi:hypothetical protein